MKLKIRQVAERLGIKNAAQLRARTGLGMKTSYQLWNEETELVSLNTLNTLCNVLQVGPAMLFEYTPDVTSSTSEPPAQSSTPRRSSPARGKGDPGKAKASAAVALG